MPVYENTTNIHIDLEVWDTHPHPLFKGAVGIGSGGSVKLLMAVAKKAGGNLNIFWNFYINRELPYSLTLMPFSVKIHREVKLIV